MILPLTCVAITLLNWTAMLYRDDPTVLDLTEPEFLLVIATIRSRSIKSVKEPSLFQRILQHT